MKFSDFPLTEVGLTVQAVGVIYHGDMGGFVLPFPGYEDVVALTAGGACGERDTYVEMDSEAWKAVLRQGDLVEVEVLAQHKSGELYKAITRKSQRQIGQQISWNVFRRDNFSCRYCGAEHLHLTVDHLVLWEEGGPSIEANLNSACKLCNKIRGHTSYAAWLRHPYYLEKSKSLSIVVKELNLRVADTLADIPRSPVIRER